MSNSLTPQQQLMRDVMNDILANPEHWNQSVWHCGTTHCFAGFVELRAAGVKPDCDWLKFDTDRTGDAAVEALGINWVFASLLFHSDSSLKDLQCAVDAYCGDVDWFDESGSEHHVGLVLTAIASRPNLSQDLMQNIVVRSCERGFEQPLFALASRHDVPGHTLQTIAEFGSVSTRTAVAVNPNVFPETLSYLSCDILDSVRFEVASIVDTPIPALEKLSTDPVWKVRDRAKKTLSAIRMRESSKAPDSVPV